jgi:hypothetical protein
MIGRKSLLQMSLACIIAMVCACGFAADAPDASTSGSCTHSVTEPQPSVVDVPDYTSDADAVADSEQTAVQTAYRDYQRSIFDALSASADPRDWALAGHMFLFTEESAIRPDLHNELVLRAAKAAPDDALVQWLASLSAPNRDGSGTSAIDHGIDSLLRIEHDNAAAWQQALAQAFKYKHESSIDEALARMATSRRYDDHFGDVMRAWLDVYERYPMPEDLVRRSSHNASFSKETVAFAGALAQAAATAMPNHSALITVCRTDKANTQNWSRNAYCADIGHLMSTSASTLLSRKMGFAVLRLSGNVSEDDVQRARDLDWLWQQETTIVNGEMISPSHFAAQANDWRASGDEIEVLKRELTRAGIPLTPSPGWISPRPLEASSGYTPNQ